MGTKGLDPYAVTTENGTRIWWAENERHAREQHLDMFEDKGSTWEGDKQIPGPTLAELGEVILSVEIDYAAMGMGLTPRDAPNGSVVGGLDL